MPEWCRAQQVLLGSHAQKATERYLEKVLAAPSDCCAQDWASIAALPSALPFTSLPARLLMARTTCLFRVALSAMFAGSCVLRMSYSHAQVCKNAIVQQNDCE